MIRSIIATALVLLFLPTLSHAWWNSDWPYRKSIFLDTTPAGSNIASSTLNVPVLVRLHTGNFAYFADVQADGADLRFMSGDDQTVIKHHIERFDPINQMALIWLQLPQLQGVTNSQQIWMYYGNPEAIASDAPRGADDNDLLLTYQFDDSAVINDASAYAIQPQAVAVTPVPASLIAAGAAVDGGQLQVMPHPAISLNGSDGFTLSAWVKPAQLEQAGAIFTLADAQGREVRVNLSGALLKLHSTLDAANPAEATAGAPISLSEWHQLVLVARPDGLSLFLDGKQVTNLPQPLSTLTLSPVISIGDGSGLQFEVDEITLAKVARSADWIAASYATIQKDSLMLAFGEDESKDSAHGGEASHLIFIAGKVDLAGWIVIVICAFMALGAGIVIVVKGLMVGRYRRTTNKFIDAFNQVGGVHADDGAQVNPQLKVYSESPLFQLYAAGLQEVEQRLGHTVGAQAAGLSDRSLLAVRSTMNSVLVRQLQRLNSMMVLLTIAISGGPFLGLLGTVIGIMLTFAGIAASGEVDINSIAPGMAAALLATVAGLAVAIPALFGYNYLAGRIKELSADMQVFIEELSGRFTEAYGA